LSDADALIESLDRLIAVVVKKSVASECFHATCFAGSAVVI
jgi:hypothetical protein